ncbi:MAG TPA: EF-hand domain-containing protein [Chloroflexia bacterium]|nr:EF-hand domain-containing protein [Chloroflexia bacterium]
MAVLSDLRVQKLKQVFTVYDANQSGYIEQSDIAAVAAAYAQGLNFAEDSASYAEFRKREVGMWEEIQQRCDANNDQKITLDEFIHGFGKWMEDGQSFEQYIASYSDAVFSAMDRDKDSKINLDEFLAMNYLQNPARGAELFGKMDSDGNGYLSQGELLKHWIDFFYSDDPQALGNFLFGA